MLDRYSSLVHILDIIVEKVKSCKETFLRQGAFNSDPFLAVERLFLY